MDFVESLRRIYTEDPSCFIAPKRLFAYLCDFCTEDRDSLLLFKGVVLSGISCELVNMRKSSSTDITCLYRKVRITKENQKQYAIFAETVCEILGCSEYFIYPKINAEGVEKTSRVLLDKDDKEKSPEEYYRLACAQKTVKGIENTTLFIDYMRKASELGHHAAMHSMARFLSKGKYVEKDINSSIELLKKCANAGNPACLNEIANLYLNELNDKEMYFEFLKRAVDAGVKEAKYDLAMLYYNNGTQDDYLKAAQILKDSAQEGDSNSMYQLALCYRFGHGVAIDMNMAMELLRRAASNGHSKAKEIVG